MLLARVNPPNLIWQSNDITLVTRKGRVTKTANLDHNLLATTFSSNDPVNGNLLLAQGKTCTRLIDFSDELGRSLEANSRFRIIGKDTKEILSVEMPLVKVVERVSVKQLNWRFKNIYWAHEETGAVWHSIQHIHPLLPKLTITTLRPAAE